MGLVGSPVLRQANWCGCLWWISFFTEPSLAWVQVSVDFSLFACVHNVTLCCSASVPYVSCGVANVFLSETWASAFTKL